MVAPSAGWFWYSVAMGEAAEDIARLNPWYAYWAAQYEEQNEIDFDDD